MTTANLYLIGWTLSTLIFIFLPRKKIPVEKIRRNGMLLYKGAMLEWTVEHGIWIDYDKVDEMYEEELKNQEKI